MTQDYSEQHMIKHRLFLVSDKSNNIKTDTKPTTSNIIFSPLESSKQDPKKDKGNAEGNGVVPNESVQDEKDYRIVFL